MFTKLPEANDMSRLIRSGKKSRSTRAGVKRFTAPIPYITGFFIQQQARAAEQGVEDPARDNLRVGQFTNRHERQERKFNDFFSLTIFVQFSNIKEKKSHSKRRNYPLIFFSLSCSMCAGQKGRECDSKNANALISSPPSMSPRPPRPLLAGTIERMRHF